MFENDALQQQVIECPAETVIVTGGPGTGKTRLLIQRFTHLAQSERAPLSSILLLTFSSNAAARFRRSIEDSIKKSYDELWVRTHQAFAASILEDYAARQASPALMSIVSPFSDYLIVKELLEEEQPRFKSPLGATSRDGLARELSDFFGLLKQNFVMPDDLARIAKKLSPRLRDIAKAYAAHEARMKAANCVGMREAAARATEVLANNPELLAEYRAKFRHILVDEFQEVDTAQYRLIELLASGGSTLYVTGDEDQRIFRFRGSIPGRFDDLAACRTGAETFRLRKNHRLPVQLRQSSENLISFNRDSGDSPSGISPDGGLAVKRYRDPVEQAYEIARDIKRQVLDATDSSPVSYSDFAVLCRSTTRSGLVLEEAFDYYDIPAVLHNSSSFYQHPMVRCIVDFLNLLVDSHNDAALLRVLKAPTLRMDPIELSKISHEESLLSHSPGSRSLYEEICTAISSNETPRRLAFLSDKALDALQGFVGYFEEVRTEIKGNMCPSAIVHSIMSRLFFVELVGRADKSAAICDAQNLKALHEIVTDIEAALEGCTLANLVEHLEHAFAHFVSQREIDSTGESFDGVAIMTVHQAKGLEFPFVYLVDMTDENFPLLGRMSSLLDDRSATQLIGALQDGVKNDEPPGCAFQLVTNSRDQLREERQLAYVAVTRACRGLTISYTEESRTGEPVLPSPFITELVGTLPEVTIDSRRDLSSAMNLQEIESALRTSVQNSPKNMDEATSLVAFCKSLDLDADFICKEAPFELEPQRALELSGHRYSASQLNTYLSCPRKFYYEKILRIAPERPEDFGLGQFVHVVLERFHKEIKNFREKHEVLEARLKQVFHSIWLGDDGGRDSSGEAFSSQFSMLLQRSAVERNAMELLERYLRTEIDLAEDVDIVSCEEFVEFRIADYPFVAKMDRIDHLAEGHRIIDYKTSSSTIQNPSTIKKQFLNIDAAPDYTPTDYQLPIYLLAARAREFNPVELTYYWLAQEDAKGMFKRATLCVGDNGADCLSNEELLIVERDIAGVIDRIIAGDFEARPQNLFDCRWCSFTEICSPKDEAVDEG